MGTAAITIAIAAKFRKIGDAKAAAVEVINQIQFEEPAEAKARVSEWYSRDGGKQ